jgi:hypothetical protein
MPTANNELVVIDQQKDLAHLEGLIKKITAYKDEYKSLTIEGPDDKEGYEKVRQAIAVLRPLRTGLNKERLEVVRPYNLFVKQLNEKYGEVIEYIQAGDGGENSLNKMKDEVDEILEKRKEEKRQAEEKKINDRINELIKNGMEFDGEFYSIKNDELGIPETSIGVVDIRTMSDDLFKNLLQLVIDKNGKITAEKERVAEIARKKKEEEDEQARVAKEKFDQEQKELKEKQEKFDKQQKEFADKQKKFEEEQKAAEQERINGIIRHRGAVLTGMKLVYNPQNESYDYLGEPMVTDATAIHEFSDTDWLNLIETLKNTIKKKDEDAAEFVRKQQEEEAERERQKEIERLAGLSDKEKLREYTNALLSVPVPELKSRAYKKVPGIIRDCIKDNIPA